MTTTVQIDRTLHKKLTIIKLDNGHKTLNDTINDLVEFRERVLSQLAKEK